MITRAEVNTNGIIDGATAPPPTIPSIPTSMPKVVAKRPPQAKTKPAPMVKTAKLAGKEIIKNAIAQAKLTSGILDLSAYEVVPKPWNIEPSVPEIKLWFGFTEAK